MSETIIEIQQRKIRNGIRKQKEREQKAIWEKLSSVYQRKIIFGDITMTVTSQFSQSVTAKTRKIKAGWKNIADGLMQFNNGGYDE